MGVGALEMDLGKGLRLFSLPDFLVDSLNKGDPIETRKYHSPFKETPPEILPLIWGNKYSGFRVSGLGAPRGLECSARPLLWYASPVVGLGL